MSATCLSVNHQLSDQLEKVLFESREWTVSGSVLQNIMIVNRLSSYTGVPPSYLKLVAFWSLMICDWLRFRDTRLNWRSCSMEVRATKNDSTYLTHTTDGWGSDRWSSNKQRCVLVVFMIRWLNATQSSEPCRTIQICGCGSVSREDLEYPSCLQAESPNRLFQPSEHTVLQTPPLCTCRTELRPLRRTDTQSDRRFIKCYPVKLWGESTSFVHLFLFCSSQSRYKKYIICKTN